MFYYQPHGSTGRHQETGGFFIDMARPIKTGLDYFPLDVNLDDKIELIEAQFGIQGFAIVIKLYQKIYSCGYFTKWGRDELMLFASRNRCEIDFVSDVIEACFLREIFDRSKHDNQKILTSAGIQKRFFTACSQLKRKNIQVVKSYLLVNPELMGVNPEETRVNPEETPVNSGEKYTKEKKGNEMKGDEIKIDETKRDIFKHSVLQYAEKNKIPMDVALAFFEYFTATDQDSGQMLYQVAISNGRGFPTEAKLKDWHKRHLNDKKNGTGKTIVDPDDYFKRAGLIP